LDLANMWLTLVTKMMKNYNRRVPSIYKFSEGFKYHGTKVFFHISLSAGCWIETYWEMMHYTPIVRNELMVEDNGTRSSKVFCWETIELKKYCFTEKCLCKLWYSYIDIFIIDCLISIRIIFIKLFYQHTMVSKIIFFIIFFL